MSDKPKKSCCGAKRRQKKSEALAALNGFLDTTERSRGGTACCRGNGKTCAFTDCGARVARQWFSHQGVRVGYDACRAGHKMRLG